MNKLQEIKEAMKNTSPVKLAKIEYQSHFMQILGVAAVCGILIFRGLWWVIFAFVFSLGVSLSQGISSYQKYHAIRDIIGDTYDVKKDKSYTRKRDYINTQVYGRSMKWMITILSILLPILFIPYNNWYMKIVFALSILVIYVVVYFKFVYFFAKKIYDGGESK